MSAAATAVYLPHLDDFFATDDFHWLNAAQNPNAIDFFGRAVGFPEATDFEFATPGWRPLIDAYFFGAYRVFGLEPLPYHIVNLVLHVSIALLLGAIIWRATGRRAAAAASSLLFAVSPSYDLVVTSISHATELWSSLAFLLSLALYAFSVRSSRRRPLFWGSFISFAFALCARQAAVELPFILLGLAYLLHRPAGRQQWRGVIAHVAPFFTLAIAYAVFAYSNEYQNSAPDDFFGVGWYAVDKFWAYLQWTVLPLPEEAYPWADHARPVLGALFIAGLALAALLRRWAVVWLFLWVVAALAPFALIKRPELEPRYTYMASSPMAALLAVALDNLRSLARGFSWKSGLDAVAAGGLVAVLVFLGHRAREQQWWIELQAHNFEALAVAMRVLCPELPARSDLRLIDSPAFDPVGINTSSLANVWYEDVYVEFGPAPGRAQDEAACTLAYSDGAWQRRDE